MGKGLRVGDVFNVDKGTSVDDLSNNEGALTLLSFQLGIPVNMNCVQQEDQLRNGSRDETISGKTFELTKNIFGLWLRFRKWKTIHVVIVHLLINSLTGMQLFLFNVDGMVIMLQCLRKEVKVHYDCAFQILLHPFLDWVTKREPISILNGSNQDECTLVEAWYNQLCNTRPLATHAQI